MTRDEMANHIVSLVRESPELNLEQLRDACGPAAHGNKQIAKLGPIDAETGTEVTCSDVSPLFLDALTQAIPRLDDSDSRPWVHLILKKPILMTDKTKAD